MQNDKLTSLRIRTTSNGYILYRDFHSTESGNLVVFESFDSLVKFLKSNLERRGVKTAAIASKSPAEFTELMSFIKNKVDVLVVERLKALKSGHHTAFSECCPAWDGIDEVRDYLRQYFQTQ